MQYNAADHSSSGGIWLIAHERDDPMVLTQAEYPQKEAAAELRRLLRNHAGNGMHVEPPEATDDIGRRYDVSDADGWLATYWLSEEQLASDDGMLTAIVSPGAMQRGHHTSPLK